MSRKVLYVLMAATLVIITFIRDSSRRQGRRYT